MSKEAMRPERVQCDRRREIGGLLVLAALLVGSAGEAVAKKARHQVSPALSGRSVEALLPPALLGDWSALLGDGIPGTAVSDDEMLVAWVRPYLGTIEVRLLRDGTPEFARSLPALGAYGTPRLVASDLGWLLSWAGEDRSLCVSALAPDLASSMLIDLGQGVVLAAAAAGHAAHVVVNDTSLGTVVWSLALEPLDETQTGVLATPDIPIHVDFPKSRGLVADASTMVPARAPYSPRQASDEATLEFGLSSPLSVGIRVTAFALLDVPIDILTEDAASHGAEPGAVLGAHPSYTPDVPPVVPLPRRVSSSVSALSDPSDPVDLPSTSGHRPMLDLTLFATPPCEVIDGPSVTLAWELPGPDAGAISLELDEAGLVRGFDLLSGLPRACAAARGPSSASR